MKSPCQQRRAVFVGLARNCAWFLPAVIQNIERLATLYRQSAVVIIENDSSDASKSILRDWLANRANGTLIELDGLAAREPKRTQRISTARNAALDYIRSSPIGSWDHLVVLDLDDVNTHPISCNGFERAVDFLEGNPTVAGVFANQSIAYYDIWALRSAWCRADCWKQISARPQWMSLELAKTIYVHVPQVVIPEHAPPIRVDSAFGGLAIYKLGSIANFKYEGLDVDGTEICEHVAFNQQISESGGQLFIYPGLINQTSTIHIFSQDLGRRKSVLLHLVRVWQTFFPPWLK